MHYVLDVPAGFTVWPVELEWTAPVYRPQRKNRSRSHPGPNIPSKLIPPRASRKHGFPNLSGQRYSQLTEPGTPAPGGASLPRRHLRLGDSSTFQIYIPRRGTGYDLRLSAPGKHPPQTHESHNYNCCAALTQYYVFSSCFQLLKNEMPRP